MAPSFSQDFRELVCRDRDSDVPVFTIPQEGRPPCQQHAWAQLPRLSSTETMSSPNWVRGDWISNL